MDLLWREKLSSMRLRKMKALSKKKSKRMN
jgi:hypothetical protein